MSVLGAVGIVIFVGSAQSIEAEESLFRRPVGDGAGTIECCPPGVEPGDARCLLRLPRGGTFHGEGASAEAACKAIGVARLLGPSSNDSARRCPPERATFGPARELGVFSEDFDRSGWYGADVEDCQPYGVDIVPLARSRRSQIAMGSPACENYGGNNPACTSYEQVDLFLGLEAGIGIHLESMAARHPWRRRGGALAERVIVEEATSGQDVVNKIQVLGRQCKVLRRVTVSSHGQPGMILIGDTPERIPTPNFLLRGISPCMLVPYSQIQFTGCLQACREAVGPLTEGIESVWGNPRYRTEANAETLEGVRVLLNTDIGYEQPRDFIRRHLLGQCMGVRPANGVAIQLQLRGSELERDTDAPNSCPEGPGMSDWNNPLVRNPYGSGSAESETGR